MGTAVRSNSLAAEAGASGLTSSLSPPEGSATLEHRRALMPRDAWFAIWEQTTVRRLLVVGLPVLAILMLLAATDVGGQLALWENAHWTWAGLLATAVAAKGAHRATGTFDCAHWSPWALPRG